MQRWEIQQMNVYNVIFKGDLHEELYMDLRLGFAGDKVTIWT